MHIQITYSSDTAVTGTSNGLYQVEIDFENMENKATFVSNFINTNADDYIQHQNEIKILDFEGLRGKLIKNAKLTDLLRFSPYVFGVKFIISQVFKKCIFDIGVDEIEFNIIPIDIENSTSKYFLLNTPWIPLNEVLFKKSNIYIESMDSDTERKYMKINSVSEFNQLIKADPFVEFEKICLPNKYSNMHLISIQGINNLFISNRLLLALKSNNLSNLLIPNNQIELCFK